MVQRRPGVKQVGVVGRHEVAAPLGLLEGVARCLSLFFEAEEACAGGQGRQGYLKGPENYRGWLIFFWENGGDDRGARDE